MVFINYVLRTPNPPAAGRDTVTPVRLSPSARRHVIS